MTVDEAPRFTREELNAAAPPDTEPADFADFWRATYEEAMSVDLQVSSRPIWSPDSRVSVQEIYYTSLDGYRIGAWVARPREPHGAMVLGHGYGGRPWFEIEHALAGYTSIMYCTRGFHLSSDEDLPWLAADHVVHGITSRETYIIRGSVADLWLAARSMIELYPDTAENLVFNGGSFGGGIGALALPWDPRFRMAHLEVPTFGNHPVRLSIPCMGSGEAVRRYWLDHPEVEDVLAYYDAATAAKHLTIPTLCSPALFDPAVTPPGQFAVANALPNSELYVQDAGHSEFPDMERKIAALRAYVYEFFDRGLATG
jgi:cephalosporin-C deacetylase